MDEKDLRLQCKLKFLNVVLFFLLYLIVFSTYKIHKIITFIDVLEKQDVIF